MKHWLLLLATPGCTIISPFFFDLCGNGLVETERSTETCDDGNLTDGDGCSSDCQLELAPNCGNSITDPNEECDDTNSNNGDGCDDNCQIEAGFSCTGEPSVCILICGNSFVDPGEECDDGNFVNGDGCDATCQTENDFCGNNTLDPGEQCDDGNLVNGDGCDTNCQSETPFTCGNNTLNPGEQCDDGNNFDNDGCDSDCQNSAVKQIAAGGAHTCAMTRVGSIRCWGRGSFGQLGYGNTSNIGDDETPNTAGNVDIGGRAIQITAGTNHTCAIRDDGDLFCWGEASNGRLGYGNADNIGDSETPITTGNVNLGGVPVQVSAGGSHTCALLTDGTVFCWGAGDNGRLGYNNIDDIGDDEVPATVGAVPIGFLVTQIETGNAHTCALSNAGNIRCWGLGTLGRLGYGNVSNIGDGVANSIIGFGDVLVSAAQQLTVGGIHNCITNPQEEAFCWGRNNFGQLGQTNTIDIGDDETPSSVPPVSLGFSLSKIEAGDSHTCAISTSGNIRCWGNGTNGKLGYDNTNNVGDNESPNITGEVLVGGVVEQMNLGEAHTCALLDNGNVRCWGLGTFGRLGYGNSDNVGDGIGLGIIQAGNVPIF